MQMVSLHSSIQHYIPRTLCLTPWPLHRLISLSNVPLTSFVKVIFCNDPRHQGSMTESSISISRILSSPCTNPIPCCTCCHNPSTQCRTEVISNMMSVMLVWSSQRTSSTIMTRHTNLHKSYQHIWLRIQRREPILAQRLWTSVSQSEGSAFNMLKPKTSPWGQQEWSSCT